MEGLNRIIPVYKPPGPSTYDLIRIFRKTTGFKGKIGHGGTLDPFACGVVLLLIDKATERFEEIKNWQKEYTAGIRLDAESNTGDITGEIKILSNNKSTRLTMKPVEETLKLFVGEIEQKVPPYSAAKFQGKPLYKLARKGIEIEKIKKVKIFNIELIYFRYPILTIRICCSGGVYIRQLAQDIAQNLETNGFLYFLQRERVGEFTIKDCYNIQDFINITI
ncbi:MAG: tRNA pseudouridine(55) synthase TruB [candidate division WOR-3 bacterium]